jgi:hypothetical protein
MSESIEANNAGTYGRICMIMYIYICIRIYSHRDVCEYVCIYTLKSKLITMLIKISIIYLAEDMYLDICMR